MGNRYGAIAKLSVAAIAACIFIATSSATAYAIPLSRAAWPIYTVIVEKTTPPDGWAEFCRNYKSECDIQQSLPRKIALTTEVWDKLSEVNRWANGHIKPTPDRKHWGRINKWYFAEDGRGDCKDYVLVKRRMLMQAGLPREALLITVVWTPQNNGHAVLIVRTDKGDYVLDNLSSKVVLWKQTPYDYVMRQTQANPNAWVYIDGDSLKPSKLADEIAENPLHEPTVMVSGLNDGLPKLEVIADSETDAGKSKPQMIASRSVNDSTPSRTASSQMAADASIRHSAFKQEFVASRQDVIATFDVADASAWKAQMTVGTDEATSNQRGTMVNIIDDRTLKQLLASGVDGETVMQLALANGFKGY
jgi:predicted transglutaminase-like cysteine proteinase